MLQTMWDAGQQIIRILLYAGAGALVTYGIIDDVTATALAGAVLGVINGVWTVYWNRNQVVTVDGLAAAAKDSSIPISGSTSVEVREAKQ